MREEERVFVCVAVSVRVRERDKETDRQRGRQAGKERQRKRLIYKEGQIEINRLTDIYKEKKPFKL